MKPTGMTIPEKQAYDWAIKQGFQSVAADYARKLAQYIERSHKRLDEFIAETAGMRDKWTPPEEVARLQTKLKECAEHTSVLSIERHHLEEELERANEQVDKWIKDAGDLQTEIGRLEARDKALVMSDEEMQAYEWCIEQGPKAVAGDYACRLAQYIRNVKLAYRKDSAEERNCDTCAITGLLCPIRNDDPPFTFPCPHWKSLAEEQMK